MQCFLCTIVYLHAHTQQAAHTQTMLYNFDANEFDTCI